MSYLPSPLILSYSYSNSGLGSCAVPLVNSHTFCFLTIHSLFLTFLNYLVKEFLQFIFAMSALNIVLYAYLILLRLYPLIIKLGRTLSHVISRYELVSLVR